MKNDTSTQGDAARRVTSIRLNAQERERIRLDMERAGHRNMGGFMRHVTLRHGHREARRA